MIRLWGNGLRQRSASAADGLAIGETASVFIDAEAWRVESLHVALHKDVADRLGADPVPRWGARTTDPGSSVGGRCRATPRSAECGANRCQYYVTCGRARDGRWVCNPRSECTASITRCTRDWHVEEVRAWRARHRPLNCVNSALPAGTYSGS